MAPVPVLDAATVMLVRDAVDPDGGPAIEVCMLRRNLESEFVAGAYVFPGGSLDPEDTGPEAAGLCRGRTDDQAGERLGVAEGGLSFWVAALRECFEEAGVLLAYAPDGTGNHVLDTSEPAAAARFAEYRRAVNGGTTPFLDVLRVEGLALAVDGVHYVSRWITPELAPRRYDTRFFVAAAPPGQVALHDNGETIANEWVRPADALARFEAGEIELLPPTITNLGALRRHRSVADALAWAAALTDVVTILPVVVIEDDRVLILRPGDEGYEEALAARAASAPEVLEDETRIAHQSWVHRRSDVRP